MKQKQNGGQKVISLVLLGFSFFYLLSSFKYKVGTHKIVGPGFLPLVIGLLLVACTGIHLFRVFTGKASSEASSEAAGGETEETTEEAGGKACDVAEGTRNYRAIIGIIICTTAYPLILEYLKFVFSTFAVGFAMLILLKPRSIIFSFILSSAMALGCFLIFSRLFGVALPSGPLEDLLFRIGR